MKKALITGITGQDGTCLAEFLLSKGREVHGIKRRGSPHNSSRIAHIYQDPHHANTHFFLHYGDMTDVSNLLGIMMEVRSDERYNLVRQSVGSHAQPCPPPSQRLSLYPHLRCIQNRTRRARGDVSRLMSVVDIHCHILPGPNDGLPDMATSIAIARLTTAAGIRTMIGTPHWIEDEDDTDPAQIRQITADLQVELNSRTIPPTVLLGNEAFIYPDLSDRQ